MKLKLQPGITRGSLYSMIVLFVALFGAIIGAYVLLIAKAQAQCAFDADLAGAPVTVAHGSPRPSVLWVKIVSDSRVAWRGLGCPGHLPPPAPSFTRWARYYHLPSD